MPAPAELETGNDPAAEAEFDVPESALELDEADDVGKPLLFWEVDDEDEEEAGVAGVAIGVAVGVVADVAADVAVGDAADPLALEFAPDEMATSAESDPPPPHPRTSTTGSPANTCRSTSFFMFSPH